MLIFDGIQSILSLIIMMLIGYWLTKAKWLDEQSSSLFTKLVINITIPAMMFHNMISYFNIGEILQMGIGFIVIFIAIIISYLIAVFSAHLFNIPQNQHGVFSSMFSLSNTIFIGLPVNIALFGEQSIPYALTYFIANTTIFWTLGVYGIRKDVEKAAVFTFASIKRVFTPPFISFLISIPLIALGITIPRVILDTTKMIGGITSPIASFYIGTVFYYLARKRVIFNRQIILIVLGRVVISPLVMFLFLKYTQLPPLMRNVFIIQSAMPVMTQLVIIAKAYGADEELAALGATVTIVISLLTIPIYMTIFNM